MSKNRDRKCHKQARAQREEEKKNLEERIAEAERKQLAAESALTTERETYANEKKSAEEEVTKRQAERKERHAKKSEDKKKRKEERRAKKSEEEKKKKAQEEEAQKSQSNTSSAPASAASAAAVAATTANSNEESAPASQSEQGSQQAAGEQHQEEDPSIPAKIVIVGGRATAFNALKQILSLDAEAEVVLITDEPTGPFDSSPLSKELLWQTEVELSDSLQYRYADASKESILFPEASKLHPLAKNVKVLTNTTAIDLDAGRHILTLEDGTQYKYEKCLLAPGLVPNKLDVALPAGSEKDITHFRSVEDFKALHKATLNPDVKHITVIGNDFIAADLVDGLTERSKVARSGDLKVSQVFPEEAVLSSIFPSNLASYFSKVTEKALGVDVNAAVRIESILAASPESGHKYQITLDNEKIINTDHIVLSIGGTPNIQLAKRAIIEIDELTGGIAVNQELCARSDLYVAGDAASYFDGHLGRRRVEGSDHAEMSGRYAGMNMMGKNYAYVYQPMRWGSVAKSIYFQNVGMVDSRLDMVAVWQKGPSAPLVVPANATAGDIYNMPLMTPDPDAPLSTEWYDGEKYQRGVVYYMDGKKVVGVSMINVVGQTDVATRLITFPREFEDISSLTRQIYLGNKPKVEEEEELSL